MFEFIRVCWQKCVSSVCLACAAIRAIKGGVNANAVVSWIVKLFIHLKALKTDAVCSVASKD